MAVFLDQAKQKILDMRLGEAEETNIQIVKFAVSDFNYQRNPVTSQAVDLVSKLMIGTATEKNIKSAYKEEGSASTVVYECELTESECSGKSITAIALYDGDDMCVCIKTFPPKEKTGSRTMVFYLRDTFEGE